jgi:hypothetical protein
MAIEVVHFVQHAYGDTDEYLAVRSIADQLLAHLNEPEVLNEIEIVNRPGASSYLVQNTFLAQARELGFSDESKGLFSDYANNGLRPDYYMKVEKSGIILEVERGKTTINNMDFLDFWKCHLCKSANYLFLLVPKTLVQNTKMKPRNEFATVVNHLSPFFEPDNYTNVRGLSIFGY